MAVSIDEILHNGVSYVGEQILTAKLADQITDDAEIEKSGTFLMR